MAAPTRLMLTIKQVFDISDTHVSPAVLCNTWKITATMATTRGGNRCSQYGNYTRFGGALSRTEYPR